MCKLSLSVWPIQRLTVSAELQVIPWRLFKNLYLSTDFNQMRKALSRRGNETLHLGFPSISVYPWCLRYFMILNFSFPSHYREPLQIWNSDPGLFAGLRPLWYRTGVRTVFLHVPSSKNINCIGSLNCSEVPFCLLSQSKLERKKNYLTACKDISSITYR